FFQAEDGIRDATVTGVQTCALPIFLGDRPCGAKPGVQTIRPRRLTSERPASRSLDNRAASRPGVRRLLSPVARAFVFALPATGRSEERRVGKGCGVRRSAAT